jgi:hypothetical protein
MTARICVLDIERQSGVVDGIWELKQHSWLQPNQIVEKPRTICFAYKWLGEDKTYFHAEWDRGGHQAMIEKAHKVFDEADYIVGWNSKGFDCPHLRTAMAELEMRPPSPHKDIDLMLTAKRNFKYMSNRLNYVAQQLGCGVKLETGGGDLWRKLRYAAGQELSDARRLMQEYNMADVDLTERVFFKMLPWVQGLNLAAFQQDSAFICCSNCSSLAIQWRGVQVSATRTYRRFQCQDCGKWGREVKSSQAATSAAL